MSHTEGESTYFAVVGCMDGKSAGPATEYGREITGREHGDQISRAGLVKTVAETGSLEEGVIDQLGITFGHHGANTAIVHTHYPDCAGYRQPQDTHEQAAQQTAFAIEEQFPGVIARPVLVETHTGTVSPLARMVPVLSRTRTAQ